MKKLFAAALLALCLPVAALAEEGMWTFDNFPSKEVEKQYGFGPDAAWLRRVQQGSVRISLGGSGSIVSEQGLVMTNHHVASSCISELSTAKQNLLKNGFLAQTQQQERKCPGAEVAILASIEDVTDRVVKASAGLTGQAFNDAQQAEISRIEKSCGSDAKQQCQVVALYRGGRFALYRYRRYQDVRLVFAPEQDIAFFGGDPDNFNFPRYDLDVAFLRLYEDGKPLRTPNYLRWNANGPKEGELVFISGNPGSTQRLLTVAQLETLRDVILPSRLIRLAELRGVLSQFSKQSPENERIAREDLFSVENSFKALKGQHQALLDRAFFESKRSREADLRRQIAADVQLARQYGDAWDVIAKVQQTYRNLYHPYTFVERGAGFNSQLFTYARLLVRAAAERGKPNEKRLPEFSDAALPSLTNQLFSEAPIYPQLEETTLSFSLNKLREHLSADDPLVRKVLGKNSPETLAKQLVSGSKLADPKERKRLWEGGTQAIQASSDPMIRLALRIDPDARALRTRYEDTVEAIEKQNGERLARALFALQGTSVYPDATFSPRLSYGRVVGYSEGEQTIKPFTTLAGLFERATGEFPFALPKSWLTARPRLDPNMPFNFVSSNDIIGGNSGSPVINQRAEVVGLIFDGNIHSLGGAFGYDARLNRSVSVTTNALTAALDRVYGAKRLIDELQKPTPVAGAPDPA